MTDAVDRAHLTGVGAPTPPIDRYSPSPRLQDLVRQYWIPVWDLPVGTTQTQSVLQYPVSLIVIAHDYARFYGVVTGLSTVELSGTGWAFGVMLQPAAGRVLWDRPVSDLTDTHVDITSVRTIDGAGLRDRVRAHMSPNPSIETNHQAAIAVMEEALGPFVPVDTDDLTVNGIVDRVESDPTMTQVSRLADVFSVSERTLGRLTKDRLGVTPKWLIQRRRLHEAVGRIKHDQVHLGDLAADLGYTDQSHFTRDFRRVTGRTPGDFLTDQPHSA